MKNSVISLVVIALCCLAGCYRSTPNIEEQDNINQSSIPVAVETIDSATESHNRTLIANALLLDEGARSVNFILKSFVAIEAGKLQSAELVQENGENMLDIISESQHKYRIFLSGNNTVEAIKDITTGEWLITSEK